MNEKPRIPPEILAEIRLKEPVSIKKNVTLLYDATARQFSIKIPTGIIEEAKWKAGDKIDIEIDDEGLKLRKAKAD
ncbi:MAG: hypothetical protein FIB07_13510 [Candidatus Methanoperedens sp.]|nr:hypothetical protein [Candidatus Methanoperedens sp.]